MCGIIGFFNVEYAPDKTRNSLKTIEYRGQDGSEFDCEKKGCFGHCLHAINDKIQQPLTSADFSFVANCEIYNWKELDKNNGINSRNDAESLSNHLLRTNDFEKSLSELDGVYAFALWNKRINQIFLARDLIGVKPLWYYFEPVSGAFAFASEKKALKSQGLEFAFIKELNPRKFLRYDIEQKTLSEYEREFFKVKENHEDEKIIIDKTKVLLQKAIKKRLSDKKIGVLFSGGIDSTFIALQLKKLGIDFTCYTAGMSEPGLTEPSDLIWAKKAAKKLDLKLNIKEIGLDEVPTYLKKILPLIEDNNVVKAGVALPFFLAAKEAKKDGVKILFSGLGSEEIFAGYDRHKKSLKINEECLAGLRKMYERDLYRDDVITMFHTIELRLPFLDKELADYALSIPEKLKLNDEQNKIILRIIAKQLGLPEEFADRKKKAAQYGSNFDKAIQKLANQTKKSAIGKQKGKMTKAEYLKQFYDEGNVRLGALLSTGKDSLLATQIMLEQNYEIACFMTIKSENKDSYMYHGPNTHLAQLQAKAANIPIVFQETKGVKEEELKDLKQLIKKGISEYKIEGIVTGALFSNYQRERIEKICDELNIKCFSPLWHMDQEKEIKLLIKKDFKFCMVKTAAEGLDSSWLGKQIGKEELNKLVQLNRKIGFNIAGEGGEYESLVLDAPFFKQKIILKKTKIVEESEINATLIVEEAKLE